MARAGSSRDTASIRDIVVDNDPAKEYAGDDEQLNKAIEVIMDSLKTQEHDIPPVPDYPIKK